MSPPVPKYPTWWDAAQTAAGPRGVRGAQPLRRPEGPITQAEAARSRNMAALRRVGGFGSKAA